MISRLTLAHPAGKPLAVDLDPEGATTIALPSGAGKSLVCDALRRILTGDGGPDVVATTMSGITLEVTARYRQVTVGSVPNRTTSAAGYRGTLPGPFADAGMATLILSPYQWIDLYRGGAAEERQLRDAILATLPAGDLRATVAALMGDDARDDDPVDPRAAKLAVSAANASLAAATRARDQAQGVATARRGDLDAVPAPVDTADARAVVDAAAEWAAYDQAMAPWQEAERAVAAWKARAPVAPAVAYSEAEHQAARDAVEAERAEAEAKKEAERKAEEDRRVETARREAEERARIEAVRVEAERLADAATMASIDAEDIVDTTPEPPVLFASPAPEPAPRARAPSDVRPASKPCPTCRGTGRVES